MDKLRIRLVLILMSTSLCLWYMSWSVRTFKDVLTNTSLKKTLLLGFLGFLAYRMLEITLVKYFVEENEPTNEDNEKKQKLRSLKRYIKKKDNEFNNMHIVLGDYDSDLEEESDYRMINIENGSSFLIPFSKAYQDKKDLAIIIETDGGSIESSDMIFRSLVEYPYGVGIYIVNYAFSAGTFISLACKKIFMTSWALVGPTDPQITHGHERTSVNASSRIYMDMVDDKHNKSMSERMYMTSQEAALFHNENIEYVREALTKHDYDGAVINTVTDELCSGKYSHGKPFNRRMLRGLGLNVNDEIPEHITNINKRARRFKN